MDWLLPTLIWWCRVCIRGPVVVKWRQRGSVWAEPGNWGADATNLQKLLSKKPNSAMHVASNLKSLLRGSREATKLYHRCIKVSQIHHSRINLLVFAFIFSICICSKVYNYIYHFLYWFFSENLSFYGNGKKIQPSMQRLLFEFFNIYFVWSLFN